MVCKIIFFLIITSSIVLGQKNSRFSDSLKINDLEKRLSDVELKNKILEEKSDIIILTNDRVFSAFYTLIGILLAVITTASIWNIVQINRINKKELEAIKGSLDAEFLTGLTNLEKKLIERINKNSSLKHMELDILKLDAKFQKHLITSFDFYDAKPDANIEHMLLSDLLDSVIKIRDESYGYTDEIEDVLKAIDAYLTKHPTNYTDEHERIYAAVKKVPLGKYDYYLNKIKKQVE